ncbi:hypothetical protein VNO78_34949 [Psophocarpus tetragonolobus]|uniref:Uncharacterized protein n=1 Tax=Psophocarpus tetragonolobus TaxID=3891 RepID=A0AAN9NML6_PSOTE
MNPAEVLLPWNCDISGVAALRRWRNCHAALPRGSSLSDRNGIKGRIIPSFHDKCAICKGEIPHHLHHLIGNEMMHCSKCGENTAHRTCVSLGSKSTTWSCPECERLENKDKFWEKHRDKEVIAEGANTGFVNLEEAKRLKTRDEVIKALQEKKKEDKSHSD